MSSSRPVVRLTRTARFSAAHRYHRADWSEERNHRTFGANTQLHGHNYLIELSLKGPVDPETGMCADLARVDEILEHEVVSRLGGRDLSQELDELPTTENLALHVWRQVATALAASGARAALERVRVYESPELFVDYEGDEAKADP